MQSIQTLIQSNFEQVDLVINEQLTSDVPLVEQISEYIVQSGGKRLRPVLVLLSCGLLNNVDDKSARLAAAIEFLHTATLLHDDVVDTSDMRRGKSTANHKWGNAPSVLVGDFLYARSFELLVSLRNMDVMECLSQATRIIAEGEVMQLTNIGNVNLTQAQYYEVIYAKTAKLFEASCVSAAMLNNASSKQIEALIEYGKQLGLAFQLVDDVLDYCGDAAVMGKNVGDDLAEGKATLPLIYCLANAKDDEKKIIKRAIINEGLDELAAILEIIKNTGAIEYSIKQAKLAGDKASAALDCFDDNEYKTALLRLINVAIDRVS
ncbi:MAG: polyprenyl synthetase family protein [Saccharospirillaceae bacterium]|nr:polyprenyl synthetase family protein [Pseudomonadales bacterium]NRB78078.1 polyprenyl synthetase family protein [Saccharospirillaceae bacterium]